MDKFIIHRLPKPNANEILYVHSLGIEALRQFVLEAKRCSTDDHPAEASAVYSAIGSPQLSDRQFACLTAYIAETFHGRITQGLYSQGSNLGLVINRQAVTNRVLVLNGDVGTLGRDVLDGNIVPTDVKGIWGTESDLASHLARLSKNSRYPQAEPRLRGVAFEARLFDGIAPADVSQVYVENHLDKEAMRIAFDLQTLCDNRRISDGSNLQINADPG